MTELTAQTASPSVPQNSSIALLMDPVRFDHLVRVGKMLALSPLFPSHLRGGSLDAGTANGVLVLNMAQRLNEDVLTVAQNIYFVGGRPGWNTTYMIAKANQHGVFKDVIDWDVKGAGDTLSVTAFAVLKTTGRRVSVMLDMETAKKEGWTKNAKYQSIPEQMLRYRSAAFLIRLYCPEVMIGVPSIIEIEMESARDISPDDAPVIEANGEPPIDAKAERVAAVKEGRKDDQKVSAAQAQPAAAKTAESEQASLLPDQPSEPAPDGDRFQELANMILADVASGTPRAEIVEMYEPQIDVMKKHFPPLAKAIDDALKAQEERA